MVSSVSTSATAAEHIRRRIKKASETGPLAASSITLLAASKNQSAARIEEAIEAGIVDFGENRVQEAKEKWSSLRQAYPNIRLHLIGPLQTNKVEEALALFDVIETLDRPKLAEAIIRAQDSGFGIRGKEFYIQVNTGKEPQKAGVIPEKADAFIEYCIKRLRLPVTGLMCIPPHGQPPAAHFALLRNIALAHGLTELSMGMSEDFETAIRMGSTCVRIGRALFSY